MQVCMDQRWIDRLVDDELTKEDRRALLCLVESHPEGWRRVATAFLEAQAWREVGVELASERIAPTPAIFKPEVAPGRFNRRAS